MEIEIDKSRSLNFSCDTHFDFSEIPRISREDVSFDQFFHEFMSKNLPVVIRNIEIKTATSKKWFDNDGKFCLENLKDTLEGHEVPVANCSKQYFDSHEKMKMTFGAFVDYWNDNRDEGLLYLKDFHLKQELPSYDFYDMPFYFASDWLNEFLIDKGRDDYRFIYIGPKGTWTPFHSDVFGSYSWSANIYGRKQWNILPPGEEDKLKDPFGNLPFSITQELLKDKNVKYFDLIQESGETLFVPTKWFHQVNNLDDAVSVNHNWFNGCNALSILSSLLDHQEDVVREISDCKDMENFAEHCQLMLKSSFGMNVTDFVEILEHIADKRIKSIQEESNFQTFEAFTIGTNLMIYDLKVVLEVFMKLKLNEIVQHFEDIVSVVCDCEERIKIILANEA